MFNNKCLHGDIHRTYNMHDALYNSKVIEKALEMLSNRYLRYFVTVSCIIALALMKITHTINNYYFYRYIGALKQ